MTALLVVLLIAAFIWGIRNVLQQRDFEIERENRMTTKLVYLTTEDIETLEAIADRIETFQHRSDAALLRNMIEVAE